MRFWLDSEYSKWIFDPDSPEAKEAKREKVKPPAHPIVPPTAHRPASVAEKYLQSYLGELAEHAQKSPRGGIESGKRLVTLAEFDRALGLL